MLAPHAESNRAATEPPWPATRSPLQWDAYEIAAASDRSLREIGLLRRRDYAAAGTVKHGNTPLIDELDWAPYVRHLVWRDADGRAIVAIRLAFPACAADTLDAEVTTDLRADLPRREQVVEASRMVFDPSLDATRSCLAVQTALSYEVVQSGRQWALLCAGPRLRHVYEALGCRDLGIAFDHPLLNNTPHQLYLGCERSAVQCRLRRSFLLWSVVFAPAAARLLRNGLHPQLRLSQRAWLRTQTLAAAVVRWMLRHQRMVAAPPGLVGAALERRPLPATADATWPSATPSSRSATASADAP